MATTNDIKNGTVLKLEGQLWNIIEFQHVKPGKGGAFVRTKMRNILSGKVVDKTFNAGLKIETATVDRSDFQYLYKDGEDYVFMDNANYDQLTVSAKTVGDATNYMLENINVTIALHEGNPLYIELPPLLFAPVLPEPMAGAARAKMLASLTSEGLTPRAVGGEEKTSVTPVTASR